MKAYRVKIHSWTSSFRYPNLISGYQPTLDVPPLSTVLGLINAAAGYYIEYGNLNIGYYFEYDAKATDLETIYQIELTSKKNSHFPSKSVKSNIMNREFLFDCNLYIYLQDPEIVTYFRNPYYQLLLGRSGDLATVDSIEEVELQFTKEPDQLKGQIIPFSGNNLPGVIQALPKYFSNTIPRNNIGTEPYSIISCHSVSSGNNINAYTDFIDEKKVDIYFHELSFN
ncbi:MAG: type I-B CRISPR-associated protein Cas5b [bacterium]